MESENQPQRSSAAGQLRLVANQESLSRSELNALIPQFLSHVDEQTRRISEQRKRLDSAAQAIKWRDTKIEKITFELARFKSWRFGAKSERMTAEQREHFAETVAADQASAGGATRGAARGAFRACRHRRATGAGGRSLRLKRRRPAAEHPLSAAWLCRRSRYPRV